MSAGGVFQLIANDGKADRMIMATDLLNQRITDIMCARRAAGHRDPTPTLVDIEKTHILFVNAHFKPFAAIGYEYNKVPETAGGSFGSEMSFNIPQFGDFFSDMVVNVKLNAVSGTFGTIPNYPSTAPNGSAAAVAANIWEVTSPATNTYTRYTYEYVDSQGNVVGGPNTPYQNYVRYAEFPGQRLFSRVKFEVNGNPLDDYTDRAYIFHQKFKVSPGKMTGWKRLVGQEVPIEAATNLMSIAGTNPMSSVVSTVNVQGGGGLSDASETTRKLVSIVNGPQTPKATQDAQDWWIPLLFWFNKDPRLAIPSVAIPYGQRYIKVDLAAPEKILFAAPGNLFLRLTVEERTDDGGAGTGTDAAVGVHDVKRFVTLTPTLAANAPQPVPVLNGKPNLYINNIFVNPEIHDIYIKRIGFSLIRVHREQTREVTTSGDILLDQLKWPIESLFLGFRPTANVTASNTNQYRDWHRLTKLDDEFISAVDTSNSAVVINNVPAYNALTPADLKTFSYSSVSESYQFYHESNSVDTLALEAHGIQIYQQLPGGFYRDYIPYTFGGANINTPEDKGAFMVNFCLYPGTYQPSGHFNISRAREFHLAFTSSYITPSSPAAMLLVAVAINFLLISDGSAVLRYST